MTTLRKFLYFLITALFTQAALASPPTLSNTGTSWIPKEFPFGKDLSATQQAQEWAMCSATLEIFSGFVKHQMNKPETAANYQNYANGAAIAIIGVFILDANKKAKNKNKDDYAKDMALAIKYAQMASNGYPSEAKNRIGAMLENAPDKSQSFEDLVASTNSCIQPHVLEMQQLFVDTARENLFGVGK